MDKTILVVEDDRRMNEIICDYLEMAGFNVLKAFDGVEGLRIFNSEKIDLIILDIMMPKLDGWSVCRRVRQKADTLIIILSARSEEDDKLMGFEIGADEYVSKPFSPKVLVARVKALVKRFESREKENSEEKDKNLIIGEISVNKSSYKVLCKGIEIPLTAKEFEILVTLMENEGKVYTREMLIQQIWGYEYFGDGRVVDTNIKTLRKKLGSLSLYIATVIGVGYKFEVK